jgi:hypothetical protein
MVVMVVMVRMALVRRKAVSIEIHRGRCQTIQLERVQDEKFLAGFD